MRDEEGGRPGERHPAGRTRRVGTIVVVLLLLAAVVYLRGRRNDDLAPEGPAVETSLAPSPAMEFPDTVASAHDTASDVEARPAGRRQVPASERRDSAAPPASASVPRPTPASASPSPDADTPVRRELPRLVDLGAHHCIPCRMMSPILDDLGTNYGDCFRTTFIDVWQDPDTGNRYGIRVIPTQIFFDPNGRELFRHEGFFSKEDILATWRRLGYEV